MSDFSAKERDVLQLLKDYRAFVSPFGSAMPLDETHMVDAAYGPAGFVEAGAGYEERDVKLLAKSLRKLVLALKVLRGEDFDAWASLIEPYLSDPADPGSVDEMRRKVEKLDAENSRVRAENTRREKKGKPPLPEKVGHVIARQQLERHDRAIRRLSVYLRRERLHAVYPKLMSKREEVA